MVKTFSCDVRSQSDIQIGLEFGFFDTLMFLFVLEILDLLQIDIPWESPCEIDNSTHRSLVQTYKSCNLPGLEDFGTVLTIIWIL